MKIQFIQHSWEYAQTLRDCEPATSAFIIISGDALSKKRLDTFFEDDFINPNRNGDFDSKIKILAKASNEQGIQYSRRRTIKNWTDSSNNLRESLSNVKGYKKWRSKIFACSEKFHEE